MSTDLSPLGICVLGLAAERPMHPYEMLLLIAQRREERLVKVRPGTLYHTVSRLNSAGLLQQVGTDRDGNRPERTVYRITDAGRARLADRLRNMLATPAAEYPAFPLAIAEAHNLSREEVAQLLHRRRDTLADNLTELSDALTEAADRDVPRQYLLDAEYTAALLRTQIDWIDRLRAELPDLEWQCSPTGGSSTERTSTGKPMTEPDSETSSARTA